MKEISYSSLTVKHTRNVASGVVIIGISLMIMGMFGKLDADHLPCAKVSKKREVHVICTIKFFKKMTLKDP